MKVDYEEIGLRVAKRRKILNLTQEELAEQADLSKTHIRNIERSSSKCSIESLMNLADALQVTSDYLLSGSYKLVDEPKIVDRTNGFDHIRRVPDIGKAFVHRLVRKWRFVNGGAVDRARKDPFHRLFEIRQRDVLLCGAAAHQPASSVRS